MKHTKGPWSYTFGLNRFIIVSTGVDILKDVPFDEAEANAKLIAAAPELLEAVQSLLTAIGDEATILDAIILATGVIKKATE